MRCDPIQKKGMPSFFVLALFGVSPNVDSTCPSNLFPFLGMCIYRSRFIEEATQSPAETN